MIQLRFFNTEKIKMVHKINNPLITRNKNSNDRLIPKRLTQKEKQIASIKLDTATKTQTKKSKKYINRLSLSLFGLSREQLANHRILPIGNSARLDESLKLLSVNQRNNKKKKPEPLSFSCSKKFALDLINDDYYTSNLTYNNHLVTAASSKTLQTINPLSGKIYTIDSIQMNIEPNNRYTSVGSLETKGIVAATADGSLTVYDQMTNQPKLYAYLENNYVISQVSFNQNIIFLGTKEGNLTLLDTRRRTIINLSDSDSSQICGIDYNGGNYLACGRNNNRVDIYDVRNMNAPFYRSLRHNAGVKAVKFAPQQSYLIATGGGTHDKTIHLWDVTDGSTKHSINTGNQICGIHWYSNKTLFTNFGYTGNSVALYQKINGKFKENQISYKHNHRVLYSAQNPNEKNKFVTLDENGKMLFWNINNPNKKIKDTGRTNCFNNNSIR